MAAWIWVLGTLDKLSRSRSTATANVIIIIKEQGDYDVEEKCSEQMKKGGVLAVALVYNLECNEKRIAGLFTDSLGIECGAKVFLGEI